MKETFLLIVVTLGSSILRILLGHKRDQEIFVLRKELQILKRQSKKPVFTNWDRLFFVAIMMANPRVIIKSISLKPSTIIAWHRRLVKKKWDYSIRNNGRPPVTNEIEKLILQMKGANGRWGCRKISGELRTLGIIIGKSVIASILKDAGFTSGKRKFERTWMNFLASHTKRYFACDFMVIDTVFFTCLYLFSVIDKRSASDCEPVSNTVFNITANPTAKWLENVVRSGFSCIDNLPNVMVSDRDGIYGEWFKELLATSCQIELIRTPPRCPNCNAFIERWHRTFREEVLDHCIVFGIRDARKLTSEFVKYYHLNRPHQGLGQDSPLRSHNAISAKEIPKIRRTKMVDGIITNFEIAA